MNLRVLILSFKLKFLLEKEIFFRINSIINKQKNGEVLDLKKDSFEKKDIKSLLGTLKSF